MELFYAVVPYVLGILLFAILGVLVFGVVAMGSPRYSPQFRNKLMRVRVGLHAAAVLILLILLAIGYFGSGG